MPSNETPTIMLVEDDRALVSLYRQFLEERYSVRSAADGAEALENIDESVELVLLDRRMPRMSGDEFLRELRERGFRMPVAMVTAVDPGTEIVDMGFDDYIIKPVTRDDLVEMVETMLRRGAYDEVVREHFSLASKVAVLRAEHAMEELELSEEYRRLTERLEASQEAASKQLAAMAEDEFDALFRGLSRPDVPNAKAEE